MKPAFSSRSRLPALLAVLIVHLLTGGLLLREVHLPAARPADRTTLRLVRVAPPPMALATPQPARAQRPAPTALPVQPAANAITLPAAAPPTADQAVAAPTPLASAPAAIPLDLRLPARFGTARPSSLAEQMRADARANSPRETLDQRLARSMGAAMGNGETEVIDGVQGGRMIRGPNGECSLVRPSTMQQVEPSEERWRQLPAKVSDCSKLQPGARRHERPK